MSRRAIILAGGKGTRLKPFTAVIPKPLVPIGEEAILEIIIKQLASHGFTHITLTLNHLAELIYAYFGNGQKWGVKLDYSKEDVPLSTMGPLKLISDLPENFIVMNGDVLTDLDFSALYNYHVTNNNIFTISSFERTINTEYGVLETNKDCKLVAFKEKPILRYHVSMGIYIANRRILDYIPTNRPYGFDHLMHDLLAANQPASVKKWDGYWLDIGRPEDYEKAIEYYKP